jgi:hypothetical protein
MPVKTFLLIAIVFLKSSIVYSQISIEDIIEKKIENSLEQTNETLDENDLYNQLLE